MALEKHDWLNAYEVQGPEEELVAEEVGFDQNEDSYESMFDRRMLSGMRLRKDQTGWHCIAVSTSDEVYYVHVQINYGVKLQRLCGRKITAVAFSKYCDEQSTKESLIGTSQGEIYELLLDFDLAKESLTQCKFVKALESQFSEAITGIAFERFPGVPLCKYVIIVSTNQYIYQLIEMGDKFSPNFQSILSKFADKKELIKSGKCFPGQPIKSQLQLYGQYGATVEILAWLCAVGIVFQKFPGNQADQDLFIQNFQVYPSPRNDQKLLGMAISNFHIYFLQEDSLVIISRLTQKEVHQINFELKANMSMIGVTYDPTSQSLFVANNRFLYQIVINQEDKDVWRFYCESKRFTEALNQCQGTPNLSKVKGAFADYLLEEDKSKGKEIAELYSESDRTFAEITLKLIQSKQPQILKMFLECKLKLLGKDKKAQKTLICTWLVELHLNLINELYVKTQEIAETNQEQENIESVRRRDIRYTSRNRELYNDSVDQFKKFLNAYKEDLDEITTYTLIQSHGRLTEWVYFAELKGNFEMVMLHHINQKDYASALAKLENVKPATQKNLIYRYAPILVKSQEADTLGKLLELMQQQSLKLKPAKLINTLMNCPEKWIKNALEVEKYFIEKLHCRDNSVHNMYIYHLTTKKDEKSFLLYLGEQEKRAEQGFDYDFDLQYALRACKDKEMLESRIILYSMMGLYSEAIDLALTSDKLEMAKELAKKPDIETSKKLWLQIVRNLLKNCKTPEQVDSALEIMRESNLLKLEDLLPHFGENVKLSKVEEDVCNALAEYKTSIDEAMKDLDDLHRNAETVKQEIQTIKHRAVEISTAQNCFVCKALLLRSDFIIFPCTHGFHKDCLYEILLPCISKHDKVKANSLVQMKSQLEELQQDAQDKHNVQIEKEKRRATLFNIMGATGNQASAKIHASEEDRFWGLLGCKKWIKVDPKIGDLQKKISDILANECYLCSEYFIDTIKDPLNENESDERGWEIE